MKSENRLHSNLKNNRIKNNTENINNFIIGILKKCNNNNNNNNNNDQDRLFDIVKVCCMWNDEEKREGGTRWRHIT